jgi:hypothetical protein
VGENLSEPLLLVAVEAPLQHRIGGQFLRQGIEIVQVTVLAIGFELGHLRRVIRLHAVHALLEIVSHLAMGKILSGHDRKTVQVADRGAVDSFNLAVGHLADVAVAPDAGHRTVDRLMKKTLVDIIVVQRSRFIIYPEPPVLVTEKAILRIAGKQVRAVTGKHSKQTETKH